MKRIRQRQTLSGTSETETQRNAPKATKTTAITFWRKDLAATSLLVIPDDKGRSWLVSREGMGSWGRQMIRAASHGESDGETLHVGATLT